jgi:hypothetical protein
MDKGATGRLSFHGFIIAVQRCVFNPIFSVVRFNLIEAAPKGGSRR